MASIATFDFSDKERLRKFSFSNFKSYIAIKKIVLTPQFACKTPDEWFGKLLQEDLYLQVNSSNGKGREWKRPYPLHIFVTPYHAQPVFDLDEPILVPNENAIGDSTPNDYFSSATIELCSTSKSISFHVSIFYDSHEAMLIRS